MEVQNDVRHGRIEQTRIFGNFFGTRGVAELEALLADCRHERGELSKRLVDVQIDDFIRNVEHATFMDCLF